MVKSSFTTTGDNAGDLTVTVPAEQVDATIASAFKGLASRVRIPGFRPGHAPRQVLEQQLGRDYILTTALEDLINYTYPQAADQERLRTVGQADFPDPEQLEEGKNYTYTVTVALRPELTLTDTKVSITMPPREATDAEVDQQVEVSRQRFGQILPAPKDAVVTEGGVAIVSFTSTIDGEPFEGSEVDDLELHLGQGMMPPQFEEALIGKTAGETATAEFVIEDTGVNSDFAGKTIHFDAEVKVVADFQLPDLDDEFAKQMGFDSLEALRDSLRTYLNNQRATSYERMQDDALLAALVEKMEGEVPEQMIESRLQRLSEQFGDMLQGQKEKMTLDEYLQMTGQDPQAFANEMRQQAEIGVRQDLALEALARAEKLVADEEEADEELAKVAEANKMEADAIKERWLENGLMTNLLDDLTRRNALEWLRSSAEIEIVDEAEQAAAKKPAVKKSAAKAAAKKPAAKTANKKSAAKKPAAEKPAAKKPATKKED
ncbi:MAG: trigger factor [Coriobacteriia bacterium]|nr:trigger factor [Coriobacteriia bacterium]